MKIFFSIPALMILLASCGNSGKEVKIGKQIWMKNNLNVTSFRDGTPIPEIKGQEEWVKAGQEGKPAWCYYKDKAEMEEIGRIYNWAAVSSPKGLAPEGWHVATDDEWAELIRHAGSFEAGQKLKSKNGWRHDKNGSDEFGFSVYPGGGRGYPYALGDLAAWFWTATEKDNDRAYYRYLTPDDKEIRDGDYEKWAGMRVRCVKDK